MKSRLLGAFCVCSFVSCISISSHAAILEFDFSGRLTFLDPGGSNVIADSSNAGVLDPFGLQIPVSATLTFDSVQKGGSIDLFVAPFNAFGAGGTTMYDISIEDIGGNLLLVNMLVDWSTDVGIPVSMVWDASGLYGAINNAPGGLQVGDTISGDVLKRGGSTVLGSVGSATPATDGVTDPSTGYTLSQGPAPLAMTTLNTKPLCTAFSTGDCYGTNPSGDASLLLDDGIAGSPLIDSIVKDAYFNLDIGSGNSMTVTAVSSVPLPAAVWLFGSGLLGLFGVARRTKA